MQKQCAEIKLRAERRAGEMLAENLPKHPGKAESESADITLLLELLIAIPAHVYARVKDNCCGGFYTVWGLAADIAVMLFAFGPGVFFLFTRRLKSIQNKSKNSE